MSGVHGLPRILLSGSATSAAEAAELVLVRERAGQHDLSVDRATLRDVASRYASVTLPWARSIARSTALSTSPPPTPARCSARAARAASCVRSLRVMRQTLRHGGHLLEGGGDDRHAGRGETGVRDLGQLRAGHPRHVDLDERPFTERCSLIRPATLSETPIRNSVAGTPRSESALIVSAKSTLAAGRGVGRTRR